jgi:hypothetical protein
LLARKFKDETIKAGPSRFGAFSEIINIPTKQSYQRATGTNPARTEIDAKADAYLPMITYLSSSTLDVNTTHFTRLPPFSILEISRILSLRLLRCYK